MSYRELTRASDAVARALRERGVQRGEVLVLIDEGDVAVLGVAEGAGRGDRQAAIPMDLPADQGRQFADRTHHRAVPSGPGGRAAIPGRPITEPCGTIVRERKRYNANLQPRTG